MCYYNKNRNVRQNQETNWSGETGTLCTAVGVENGAATMENDKVIPQKKKIKNRMIPFWIQTPKN